MDATQIETRRLRGAMLAKSKQIKELKPGLFVVPSQAHSGSYVVDPEARTCTCADHATTGEACKHVWAVDVQIGRATVPEETTLITTKKPTYQQNWTAYNAAQTTEKARFEILLRDLVSGIPQPEPKKTGLPPPATPGPGGGGERAHWAVDDEGGDGPRSLSARGHPGPDGGG
jgi:hypothetical protein